MSNFNQQDIYQRYLDDGINNFSTKELLDLTDILYGLGKYHEIIDVAEYTISLIDMGISNNFIDDGLDEWYNELPEDDAEGYNIEQPEEYKDEKEEEDIEDGDEERSDDIN